VSGDPFAPLTCPSHEDGTQCRTPPFRPPSQTPLVPTATLQIIWVCHSHDLDFWLLDYVCNAFPLFLWHWELDTCWIFPMPSGRVFDIPSPTPFHFTHSKKKKDIFWITIRFISHLNQYDTYSFTKFMPNKNGTYFRHPMLIAILSKHLLIPKDF